MDAISAGDGLVIAMLIVMVLALGVVALLLLTVRNHAGHRDDEVEKLLDEVSAEVDERREKPERPGEEKVSVQPWERDGDWWKS